MDCSTSPGAGRGTRWQATIAQGSVSTAGRDPKLQHKRRWGEGCRMTHGFNARDLLDHADPEHDHQRAPYARRRLHEEASPRADFISPPQLLAGDGVQYFPLRRRGLLRAPAGLGSRGRCDRCERHAAEAGARITMDCGRAVHAEALNATAINATSALRLPPTTPPPAARFARTHLGKLSHPNPSGASVACSAGCFFTCFCPSPESLL